MAENVNDLTIQYEQDGVVTVKESDKKILTKGAWATVIFKYQDYNPKSDDYGPFKYSIRRFQKRNGVYQQKSKFNISSNDQAEKIIQALTEWMSEETAPSNLED